MGFFDSWKVKVNVFLRHPVVFPGNVVEGFVEINNTGNIDVTAIRVEAIGKEAVTCRRETRVNDAGDTRTETYCDETTLYEQLVTLCGNMKSSGSRSSFVLPPGRYTYPFAFQLPANLPPSFAKRAGDDEADIMYFVRAYVDIPMGRDAEVKRHFTVLNAMPEGQWRQQPSTAVERSWDVTCCCCVGKGKVSGRLWMDKALIAVDRDQLMFCADLDNSGGENPVESVEVSLIHHLRYRARHVTERHRVVAGKTVLNNARVEPGQRGRINGVVPVDRNLIPSLSTFHCESRYEILVELSVPMASDPSHTFPVVLTHCVDATNFLPPVSFAANKYPPAGPLPELYYAPPPQPVVPYNPVPFAPPPGAAPMPMQYDFNGAFGVLPNMSAGWQPPSAYQQPPAPVGELQWSSGYSYTSMTVALPSGGAAAGVPPPGQCLQPQEQPPRYGAVGEAPPPAPGAPPIGPGGVAMGGMNQPPRRPMMEGSGAFSDGI